jgi:hypothetical protein
MTRRCDASQERKEFSYSRIFTAVSVDHIHHGALLWARLSNTDSTSLQQKMT